MVEVVSDIQMIKWIRVITIVKLTYSKGTKTVETWKRQTEPSPKDSVTNKTKHQVMSMVQPRQPSRKVWQTKESCVTKGLRSVFLKGSQKYLQSIGACYSRLSASLSETLDLTLREYSHHLAVRTMTSSSVKYDQTTNWYTSTCVSALSYGQLLSKVVLMIFKRVWSGIIPKKRSKRKKLQNSIAIFKMTSMELKRKIS